MSEHPTAHQNQVLAYLQAIPGSTARDVARDLWGGTGAPHTFSRGRAARVLAELLAAGLVTREGRGILGDPHRWRAA